MSFKKRTQQSNLIINLFEKYFWSKLQHKLVYCSYGYETYIPQRMQDILKKIYSKTSLHVRFSPDYLLINLQEKTKDPVYLLEYKTITTPRYTLLDKQWDYGQIEADAWDNYINLSKAGINVLILIYCSYHSRPFLLDFPIETKIERKIVKRTIKGSGTDYYNINLKGMRDIFQFFNEKFSITFQEIYPYIKELTQAILNYPILHTKHDKLSKFQNFKTGFNWQI